MILAWDSLTGAPVAAHTAAKQVMSVKNLIPYDPIDLMALLELYMEDYNNESLRDVVTAYTHLM